MTDQSSGNPGPLPPAEVADLFLEGWSIDALAARQSCSTECIERVLRVELKAARKRLMRKTWGKTR